MLLILTRKIQLKLCLLNIVFLLLSLLGFCQQNQNLLLNGSFEVTDSCPNLNGQIWLANGWHNASATPDLLDSCSSFWAVGVPYNYYGYSYAKTGTKYAHINLAIYDSITLFNYETIAYKLDAPLKRNHKYYLSFWIKQTSNARYAFDRLGILFTSNYYNQIGGRIDETPQLANLFCLTNGQNLKWTMWPMATKNIWLLASLIRLKI